MKKSCFYAFAIIPALLAGCTSVQDQVWESSVMEDQPVVNGAIMAPSMPKSSNRAIVADSAAGSRFEAQAGRKMVFTANLSMSVDNVSTAMKQAEALVKAAGGYIQESADYYSVLRIPVDKADETMRQLEQLGSVTSRRIVGSDVTDQVTELDIRLANLRSMRTRLLELLKKAEKVEDALKIETELNRVVTDIELYEGQLKNLDNRISFVTLTLTFNALIKPVSTPKLPVPWMSGIGNTGANILPPPNGRDDLPYSIKLPENFAILYSDESKNFAQLYAVTADNCVLRLTRRPSMEGATLDFWRTLGRRSLTEENSYKIVKDELLKLRDAESAVFEGERSGSNYLLLLSSYRTSCCFIPRGTNVYMLEFWGPQESYTKHIESVRKACGTIRF